MPLVNTFSLSLFFSLSFLWHLSFFVFCSNPSVLCISTSVLEARKLISLANTLVPFEHGKEYQVTGQFIVSSLVSRVPTLNPISNCWFLKNRLVFEQVVRGAVDLLGVADAVTD